VSLNLPARQEILLQAALIVAAVFAIYLPALHGAWLWDDGLLVRNNALIHDPDGWWQIWFEPRKLVDYFPLTASAEWLQWHLFGDDTTGYHAVNLALHALSALLLWRLLARFGLRYAWLGGLLFAVHPVLVESVAWMAELKNTLSLPLFLLALTAWLDFGRDRRRADYLRSFALFLGAMLAKTTLVMFPFVILLHAWWRRGRLDRADFVASAPFFATSLVLGLVTLGDVHPSLGVREVPLGGLLDRFALAGTCLAFYISKCVLPFDLLPIYPQWTINPLSFAPWLTWLAVVVALAACVRARATWGRHALLGLGFFLLMLAPFLGFTQAAYMSFTWVMDHLLYVPIIGLIGLAVAAIEIASARLPRLARDGFLGAVTLLLAVLALGSHADAAIYQDEGTLWSFTVAGNPACALAHNNLGRFDLEHGQAPAALAQYHAALALKPDYTYAHNGLGNALTLQGQIEPAVAEYREAIAEDPAYAEAHNGLANVLRVMGRFDEARGEAELALKLKPRYVDPLCTLGLIAAQQGNFAEAIARFEAAQKLQPNDPRIARELDFLRASPR